MFAQRNKSLEKKKKVLKKNKSDSTLKLNNPLLKYI